MMSRRVLPTVATLLLTFFSITALAGPPLSNSEDQLSSFDRFFLETTSAQSNQTASVSLPDSGGPAIEAYWFGATQWMSGRDNGYEAFNGSIGKGADFFTTTLSPLDYVPVEIIFSSNTADWSLVQVFRRDNIYNGAGVGTFPGSAWDISDTTNPRRLNICISEYDDGGGPIPPPNMAWDPDNSEFGKFEYLFIMKSDYDGTGTTYENISILLNPTDLMYGWWPRVANGHTFFESEPASLRILTFIGLEAVAFENDAIIEWTYTGAPPDHYKLFWGNSSPPTNLLLELPGTSDGYWHSNLTKNLNYIYVLKAYNALDDEINSSKEVTVTTQELSSQMELVGYWNERSDYGDVWGYVDDATGREYALICARGEGLSIIDIDTFPQTEVAFIPGQFVGADVKDVKTYSHYAIIVSENAATKIVNISDPTNPVVISSISGGRHNCLVDGDYLYLVGGPGVGGLVIYSLANPNSPQWAGEYQPYYYHDLDIRKDTVAAAAIYGQGVDLLDVSNKPSIQLLANFDYPGSGAHNAAFSDDGNYVFIGDEIGSNGNYTRVFDISNYSNIHKVSDIIVDFNAIVHNCYVRGDYLIIGHYTEGARIWNIANPASPFEVGYFDTYPLGGYGFNGSWSVYPFLPSGRVLASDMTFGLYVFTSPLLPPLPGCCEGLRGDLNDDNSPSTNILDLTYIVDLIFRGGTGVSCGDEGDVNGDGDIANIVDLTYVVDLIFRGGPQPPACP